MQEFIHASDDPSSTHSILIESPTNLYSPFMNHKQHPFDFFVACFLVNEASDEDRCDPHLLAQLNIFERNIVLLFH